MIDLKSHELDEVVLAKYLSCLSQMLEANDNKERDELAEQAAKFTALSKEQAYHDFFLYLEEACKEKVREAVKSDNTAKKAYIKTQVLNWLRKFFEPKEAIRVFDAYSVEAKAAETFRLAELFELASKQPAKYIVKELIEVGVLLIFAAYAKTGKSLLATYMAMCIAQGKEFLGRVTEPCGVLYIQNEERLETTTAPRFYDQGLQNLEAADKLAYTELINSDKIVVARYLDIGVDRDIIIRTALEKNCKLVLIDSMRASLRKSGLTDLSSEVPGVLYALQEECHRHGITVIVIHHNTKLAAKKDDRGKTNLINGMGGVSGIAGANDGMIFAFPGEGDSDIKPVDLHFIPRNGGELKLVVEYVEEEACYWEFKVVEESTMSQENLALQNAILRLLYSRYNQWKEATGGYSEDNEVAVYGCNLQELIQLTDCSRKSVIKILNFMLKREGICRYPDHKNKNHIYCIHPSGESWMQAYLVKEDKQAEEIAIAREIELRLVEELRHVNNKEELNELTADWNKDLKRRVWRHLTSEEKNKLYLFDNPPKYVVGDIVLFSKEEDPDQTAYKVSSIYYHLESGKIRYYLEGLDSDYAEERLYRDIPE